MMYGLQAEAIIGTGKNRIERGIYLLTSLSSLCDRPLSRIQLVGTEALHAAWNMTGDPQQSPQSTSCENLA